MQGRLIHLLELPLPALDLRLCGKVARVCNAVHYVCHHGV